MKTIICTECGLIEPRKGAQRSVKVVNGKDEWGYVCKKCDRKDRYQLESFNINFKTLLKFFAIVGKSTLDKKR